MFLGPCISIAIQGTVLQGWQEVRQSPVMRLPQETIGFSQCWPIMTFCPHQSDPSPTRPSQPSDPARFPSPPDPSPPIPHTALLASKLEVSGTHAASNASNHSPGRSRSGNQTQRAWTPTASLHGCLPEQLDPFKLVRCPSPGPAILLPVTVPTSRFCPTEPAQICKGIT